MTATTSVRWQRWLARSLWLAPLALVACAQTAPSHRSAPSSREVVRPAATVPAAPQAMTSAQIERQLEAYFWDLREVRDASGQVDRRWLTSGERKAVRLQFGESRLSVQNLCNTMNARVQIEGDQLQLGRFMSTMRACTNDELMQLERVAGRQLEQVRRFELNTGRGAEPRLVLHLADGARWELAGLATPATRYGSAGERVFMEVAPQMVSCNNPLMPRTQQCLRVRDISYDAGGIKQSTGEWRVLQGGIEGFVFEPGLRKVLRLQRYPLGRNGQVPADGPSHALVMDMAVEVEIMR